MYKKFLSRPPENDKVISLKTSIIGDKGWRHIIETFLESDEYLQKFGDNLVPHSEAVQ